MNTDVSRLLTRQQIAGRLQGVRIGALLYVDVDHLRYAKYVFPYDDIGKLLRRMVVLLIEVCAGHLVASYGGDEFMIYVSDPSTAATIGERLRAAVEREFTLERSYILQNHPLAPTPNDNVLTVSVGWTDIGCHPNLASALQAVDEANQRAKVAGRNCVSS